MQEHGISFHLFMFFFDFFHQYLIVSETREYCTLWSPEVNLFLGILFFDAMTNGIVY